MLGPEFTEEQIRQFLELNDIPFRKMEPAECDAYIAAAISQEKVVAVLRGRMEFGPRALGNRSILADARSIKMQSYLNLATKFRDSFRTFAPIVLKEDASDYFDQIHDSPYMLLVDQVRSNRCIKTNGNRSPTSLKECVTQPRSDVPAITHVDYSVRIQTVDQERNLRLRSMLAHFKQLTGYGILVNTSFNVRNEPIVYTPEDAYRCFMRTGINVLGLGDHVLEKRAQPEWIETED